MQIELSFTWSLADYHRFQVSHANALKRMQAANASWITPPPQVKKWLFFSYLAVLTVLAFCAIEALFGQSLATLGISFLLISPSVWGYFYLGSWGRRSRILKAWQENPDFQQPRVFVITDAAITGEMPGIRHELEWFSLNYVYEDRFFFLLFAGTQLRIALPKRVFPSPGDEAAFRDRCAALPRKKESAFPVVQ